MIGGELDKSFGIPGPENVPIQEHDSFYPENFYPRYNPQLEQYKSYQNVNPYQYYQNFLQSQVQNQLANQFPNPQINNFQNHLYNPMNEETLNYFKIHHPNKIFGDKFEDGFIEHGIKKLKTKAKKLKGAAVSALTLLAFLFFLHILQMCLKEHMDVVNPTVLVATAGAARVSPIQDTFDDVAFDDDDDGYLPIPIRYSNASNKNKEKPKQEIWTTPKTQPKRKKSS